MEASKKQLTDRFVELTERIYLQMRSRTPEEWSDLEMTMPQARTLFLLNQGPQRMSGIAAYLGCSLPSATSMIDRLVGKGLVERIPDPADRRVVACHLTPLGAGEVDRFWCIGRMKIEAVADVLTFQELESVVHAMEILAAAAGRQADAGPPGSSEATGRDGEGSPPSSPIKP